MADYSDCLAGICLPAYVKYGSDEVKLIDGDLSKLDISMR